MKPRQARQDTSTQTARKHRPDYGLFVTAGILLLIGLVVMYAISPALAAQGGDVNDSYFVVRQFVAVAIGLVAFFVVSNISLEVWAKWQKPLIILTIVLSLATLIGGLANRWIQIGVFSFQPVELVKLAVVITFAGYLAKAIENKQLTNKNTWRIPLLIAIILGFIIVVLQRDLGSAVVLFSIALGMLFMSGFPMKIIGLVIIGVVVLGTMAITSTQYRRDRVATFLSPTQDCTNEGYHSCQALIAVGSGGIMGVGLGRSIQAYGYLPEAENDSIFAIYAEKFGFIGSVALLALFGNLLMRILKVMQKAPNRTAMLMAAGVFTWFSVQGAINIAAMLGLIPLKGITLPLVSYGGTSLIFSMMALGLVFHISKYTNIRRVVFDKPETDKTERGGHEDNGNRRRDSRPRYTVTRSSR